MQYILSLHDARPLWCSGCEVCQGLASRAERTWRGPSVSSKEWTLICRCKDVHAWVSFDWFAKETHVLLEYPKLELQRVFRRDRWDQRAVLRGVMISRGGMCILTWVWFRNSVLKLLSLTARSSSESLIVCTNPGDRVCVLAALQKMPWFVVQCNLEPWIV